MIKQVTIPTANGPEVVDTFDDVAPITNVTDVPPHLDAETLEYLSKLEEAWAARVEQARIETEDRIAADFEALGERRYVLMPPGAAAARVRLMADARRAA